MQGQGSATAAVGNQIPPSLPSPTLSLERAPAGTGCFLSFLRLALSLLFSREPHLSRGRPNGPSLKQGPRAKAEKALIYLPVKTSRRKGQPTLAPDYEGSICFNLHNFFWLVLFTSNASSASRQKQQTRLPPQVAMG